jgi:hypothetical protein
MDTRQSEIFVEIQSGSPSGFGVTTGARFTEMPAMGILVAVDAVRAERFKVQNIDQIAVFNDGLVGGFMTFRTLEVGVLASQGIFRLFVMIKMIGNPLVVIMALGTIATQLPLMNILVTG